MMDATYYCLKCGGDLTRLQDVDAVRCRKCKRTWDALELHQAGFELIEKHGVGRRTIGDATGEP